MAARSERSRVKAIIISPPAIITTFDSPLPAKLISPSFQVFSLPPSSSLPPSHQHPDQRSFLVFVLIFFALLIVPPFFKEKPVFHFLPVCTSSEVATPRPDTLLVHRDDLSFEKKEEEEEMGRKGHGNCLGAIWLYWLLQKPICTSFPLKSSRQRHAWWRDSGSGFYNLYVFRVSSERLFIFCHMPVSPGKPSYECFHV